MLWLRQWTDVPIPKVFALEDSNENPIEFEWVMMDFMPGDSLCKCWRKLSMIQKNAIVEQIADFQAHIMNPGVSQPQFNSIGTLDADASNLKSWDQAQSCLKSSTMVSLPFFYSTHYNYDVPRGPFKSSHHWVYSLIQIVLLDYRQELQDAENDKDKRAAEFALNLAQRLLDRLPTIFPDQENIEDKTCLWHDDLSSFNTLVDSDGKITAILDWECVSLL